MSINLQKLVTKPSDLKTFGHYVSPRDALTQLQEGILHPGQTTEKLIAVVATDAEASYNYALMVLRDRFEQGEPAIAKCQYHSYYYCMILGDITPIDSPALKEIMKNARTYGTTADMVEQ